MFLLFVCLVLFFVIIGSISSFIENKYYFSETNVDLKDIRKKARNFGLYFNIPQGRGIYLYLDIKDFPFFGNTIGQLMIISDDFNITYHTQTEDEININQIKKLESFFYYLKQGNILEEVVCEESIIEETIIYIG